MKFYKFTYLLTIVTFFVSTCLFAQKKIDIKYSGFVSINEEKNPGARTFTRDDSQQIHIFHDGIDMWCDQAVYFEKENLLDEIEELGLVLAMDKEEFVLQIGEKKRRISYSKVSLENMQVGDQLRLKRWVLPSEIHKIERQ